VYAIVVNSTPAGRCRVCLSDVLYEMARFEEDFNSRSLIKNNKRSICNEIFVNKFFIKIMKNIRKR